MPRMVPPSPMTVPGPPRPRGNLERVVDFLPVGRSERRPPAVTGRDGSASPWAIRGSCASARGRPGPPGSGPTCAPTRRCGCRRRRRSTTSTGARRRLADRLFGRHRHLQNAPAGISEQTLLAQWRRWSPDDLRWAARHCLLPRSDAWYRSLFPDDDGLVTGEVCPGYARLSLERIARLARLVPDLKVVYLVRDPVEVAWSSACARFAKKHGGIADADAGDGRALLVLGRNGPALRLRANLLGWRTFFPDGHIFLGYYDDLAADPRDALVRILDFLGLDSGDVASRPTSPSPGAPTRGGASPWPSATGGCSPGCSSTGSTSSTTCGPTRTARAGSPPPGRRPTRPRVARGSRRAGGPSGPSGRSRRGPTLCSDHVRARAGSPREAQGAVEARAVVGEPEADPVQPGDRCVPIDRGAIEDQSSGSKRRPAWEGRVTIRSNRGSGRWPRRATGSCRATAAAFVA